LIEGIIAIVGTLILASGAGLILQLRNKLAIMAEVVGAINVVIDTLNEAIEDDVLTVEEVRDVIENLESLLNIIKTIIGKE